MPLSLLTQLDRIRPLSEALRQTLLSLLAYDRLPKKSSLLEMGQVNERLYFIERGLARAFYFKEGQDVTAWLMLENDWIVSVESFFLQTPADESIELLEESQLVSISFADLERLYEEFPEFNYTARLILQRYYIESERRLRSLRRQTAEERFEQLVRQHPHLLARVPNKHLASYLGMTPETFSRLRAKLR